MVVASTGDFETWPGKAVYSLDAIAVSEDGALVAAAGWFGGSELVLYHDGTPVKVKKPKVAYFDIAFAGDALIGATRDGVIEKDGKPLVRMAKCQALAVSREQIATASPDQVARWSLAGEKIASSKLVLTALAFGDAGLVGISEKGALVIEGEQTSLGDPRARALAVSGKRIAVGSYDPAQPIRVFDGLTEKFTLAAAGKGTCALAFSPSGKRLAAANEDGHVRVWELARRRLILDVRGRQESMNAVVFLSDNRVAAVGRDVENGPPVYVWTIPK